VLNPCFRTQQSQAEAKPKRNTKELMWRKPSCRKERADDWARGRDPESYTEGSDHPFTMLRNAAMPDVPEPKAENDKKQDSEQSCRGSLVRATDGRGVAQDKGGDADNGSKENPR
jgi:hypothetical protein